MIIKLDEPHKRGDTFGLVFLLKFTAADGSPITTPPAAVRSQVRTRRGALMAELDVQVGDYVPDYGFMVAVSKQTTANWVVGTLEMDVEMTFPGGDVRSSDTISFECEQDKTYGE